MPRKQALFRNHSPAGLRREKKNTHHFPVPRQQEEKQGEEKDPQKGRPENEWPPP
jgi:hypothetical protein